MSPAPIAADAAAPADAPADRPAVAPSPRPSRRDFLAWSVATGGLFLGGGAVRVLNTAPVDVAALTARPPFNLDDLPKSLDGWSYIENSETKLDSMTTRITGSTGHVIRGYRDEQTGTTLSALVLYGPAEPVLPHTPQACYPASGYRSLGDPVDRTIVIDDRLSVVFRSASFARSGGRSLTRQSVYHSYRLDGVWSPAVGELSLPRRQAGLFKVQIQRGLQEGERTDADDPIEGFIRQLVPALERMIAAAGSARPAPSAADAPARP